MTKRFRLACGFMSYINNPDKTKRPRMPDWLEDPKHFGIGQKYWLKIYWATPPWITETMIQEMSDLYLSAKRNEHIDHTVPLCSPIVCGLHVPWNLEKMTSKRNLVKSNHMWPGHPCEHEDLFGDYEPYQLRLFL